MSDKAAAAIIDPPQPEGKGEYPLSDLRPSYITEYSTHEDYEKATGKTAMSDPRFPKKRWTDSRPATGPITTYTTAHLDASFQKPVVTQIQISSFMQGIVNMPPDSGVHDPAWDKAGEYLVPIRDLLPGEQLNPRQMGLIDVVNTLIFNPFAPPPPAAGSGGGAGLTSDQDSRLSLILDTVQRIAGVIVPPASA